MMNTPQPPRLQPKRSTARAIAFRRPSSSVQVGYYWLITITRHGGDHAAPNGSKQHQAVISPHADSAPSRLGVYVRPQFAMIGRLREGLARVPHSGVLR